MTSSVRDNKGQQSEIEPLTSHTIEDLKIKKHNTVIMVLSICMITYNHENYILQAIESVLKQRTTFRFELVIGEDCSTDKTRTICEAYQARFPEVIKLLPTDKNLGLLPNFIRTFKHCTGKYTAILSGDDFWIDEDKLQKQIEFLVENTEYAVCFSNYRIKDEFNGKEVNKINDSTINIADLILKNTFCAATNVFISKFFRPIPSWFMTMPFEDWPLYLYILHKSQKKAYCLQDITTVYRIHPGGLHGSLISSSSKIKKAIEWEIDFYKKIRLYLFKDKYRSLIEKSIEDREKAITDLSDERKTPSAVLSEITEYFPMNGSFILVDDWKLEVTGQVNGRKVVPFTEQNGVYWGKPANDEAAILEIERQREKGVNALIFTWGAFWWLNHYSEMYRYLQSNYKCILHNERLIGFDLQQTLT